jgi:DNA polymerase-3 subunit delta
MIHLLYGDDEFSISETLASMKAVVGTPDLRDVNITVLDGPSVSFAEMRAMCDTVPFLAERRMVVVTGLLGQFERRWGSNSSAGRDDTPRNWEAWSGLGDYLPQVPDTTDLVFVDGPLARSNRLLTAVRPHAQVKSFSAPNERGVSQWVRDRAVSRGIQIEPAAVEALAGTIGGDLRVVASELDKLAVYRAGEPVRREDVEEMVSYAREANIFSAVDAMVEGRLDAAVTMVHQLLRLGRTPGYILAMVARQVRLLILAKELKARGVPAAEHGKRLGLAGYPLRKTMDQERAFTATRLEQVHRKLLEADLQLKTTSADEELVLDLLIAEVAVGAGSR